MSKKNKTQLILGLIFLLVAGWLLIDQLKPEWTNWLNVSFSWPIWIILVGAGLMLIGLLTEAYDMAVPACIVAGIGGILYYQNTSQDWNSWSYMWALIPGFGGIGNLISAGLSGNLKKEGRNALNTILISLLLFVIFASMFGGLDFLTISRELILIVSLFLVGLWLILRGIFRKQK
jgi:hypothetical protein